MNKYELFQKVDKIFNGKIKDLQLLRKVSVPMDLRSYVINEQVEREIADIRQLRKHVEAEIMNLEK